MGRKILIINMLILIFIVSIIIGYFVAQNIKLSKAIKENDEILQMQEAKESENKTKTVNSKEEKIGINTIVEMKKIYTVCGHEELEDIDKEKIVNLTKDKLKRMYPNWDIKEFSNEKVILTQEIDNLCSEHYYVTEEENKIVVYRKYINDSGKLIGKNIFLQK